MRKFFYVLVLYNSMSVSVEPIKVVKPVNYKMVDLTLSRSGQIERQNVPWLKVNGFTDVINLRTMRNPAIDFDEGKTLEASGIKYHNIPSVSRSPMVENVNKFLKTVEDIKSAGGKVLVHCKQGADRTGMYVYIYESLNEIGTTFSRVLEMFRHGYHYRTYPHLIKWANDFVKHYKGVI